MVNKAFTALNVLVLLFVTVSGFIKGHMSNWKLREDDLPRAAAHEAGYEGLHSPCAAFRVGWGVRPPVLYARRHHFLCFSVSTCQRDKILCPAGLMLQVEQVGCSA